MKRITLFLVVVLLLGCEKSKSKKIESQISEDMLSEVKKIDDLLWIKSYLHSVIPSLSNSSDLKKAELVRDYIYNEVKLERTRAKFPFHNVKEAFVESVILKDSGHICGGLSKLYIYATEALGIPSRYAGVFQSTDTNNSSYDNHASVELFINGKWSVFDPTFNVSFESDNKLLSWAEIAYYIKTDKKFRIKYGNNIKENRKLENYQISLKDLTKFVITSPVQIKGKYTDAEIFPENWNGNITGKRKLNMKEYVYDSYFVFLGKGYLR